MTKTSNSKVVSDKYNLSCLRSTFYNLILKISGVLVDTTTIYFIFVKCHYQNGSFLASNLKSENGLSLNKKSRVLIPQSNVHHFYKVSILYYCMPFSLYAPIILVVRLTILMYDFVSFADRTKNICGKVL